MTVIHISDHYRRVGGDPDVAEAERQRRVIEWWMGVGRHTPTHCHCGCDRGGSDHCPECGCEEYESLCDYVHDPTNLSGRSLT